jgi:cyclophilin family peptidyl-prolyl cis-trans isomerase
MKRSLRIFIPLCLLLLCCAIPSSATVVRMLTPLGLIDINLYDDEAPETVTNFLAYVNRGDYDGSFIHRSKPSFVLQGGGYTVDTGSGSILTIAKDSPVVNEYSPLRSNLRGTIAMAKVANVPDSATSQWFFNLNDNSAILDSQNSGFAVFGEVMGRGMEVVDALAQLTIVNAGGVFTDLPLLSDPVDGSITLGQLVNLSSVAVLPTAEAELVDRVFNYLEQNFPEFIAPAGNATDLLAGYNYRYYPATNSYVGIRDGRIYYLGSASNNEILDIGAFTDWYNLATNEGY